MHQRLRHLTAVIIASLLMQAFTLQPVVRAQVAIADDDAGPLQEASWRSGIAALAMDGDRLWLAAGSTIAVWDPTDDTYSRVDWPAGMEQNALYDLTIEADGMRWLAGDNGVVRITPDEEWIHYATENSGLYRQQVVGIALGADGTAWFAHDLPDGPVSERSPEGAWRWHPNREAAVTAAYAQISAAQGRSTLWLVMNDEVWLGSEVYDGAGWRNRAPGSGVALQPADLWADGVGGVWSFDRSTLYHWTDDAWQEYDFPWDLAELGGDFLAMTVTADGTVWFVASEEFYRPLIPLPHWVGTLRADEFERVGSIGRVEDEAVMLASAERIWAAGSNWLWHDGLAESITLTDMPPRAVNSVLVDQDDKTWVSTTRTPYAVQYSPQRVDDRLTPTLQDDRWSTTDSPYSVEWPVKLTRDPSGAPWYVSLSSNPFSSSEVTAVNRVVDGALYTSPALDEYGETAFPWGWRPVDMYAAGDGVAWLLLVDAAYPWSTIEGHGVVRYHDAGTPANPDDDVWEIIPLDYRSRLRTVVVDRDGQVWLGGPTGVFQLVQNEFVQRADQAVCELIAAPDGSLLATLPDGIGCGAVAASVLILEGDATQRFESVETVTLDLLRSATRPNRLWSVAPDGDVWALAPVDHGDGVETYAAWLRDEAGIARSHDLPLAIGTVGEFAAGAAGRLWLVTDDSLMRFMPPPGFALRTEPSALLLAPARPASLTVMAEPISGFDGSIAFEVDGLPPTVEAAFAPNPAQPMAPVRLTLALSAATEPGQYPFQIRAQSGELSATRAATATVAAELFDTYLPQVNQADQPTP